MCVKVSALQVSAQQGLLRDCLTVQADTGSKMIHTGKHTRSRIVSKGISAGQSRNCYRGLVQVGVCVCVWVM